MMSDLVSQLSSSMAISFLASVSYCAIVQSVCCKGKSIFGGIHSGSQYLNDTSSVYARKEPDP